MKAADAIVVLVTAGNEEEAEKLARLLLEQQKIACANIVPRVRSLYHWEGKIESDDECLMVMKTVGKALPDIVRIVKEHHSYDVPEVIALPITGGSEDYLEWLAGEVTTP